MTFPAKRIKLTVDTDELGITHYAYDVAVFGNDGTVGSDPDAVEFECADGCEFTDDGRDIRVGMPDAVWRPVPMHEAVKRGLARRVDPIEETLRASLAAVLPIEWVRRYDVDHRGAHISYAGVSDHVRASLHTCEEGWRVSLEARMGEWEIPVGMGPDNRLTTHADPMEGLHLALARARERVASLVGGLAAAGLMGSGQEAVQEPTPFNPGATGPTVRSPAAEAVILKRLEPDHEVDGVLRGFLPLFGLYFYVEAYRVRLDGEIRRFDGRLSEEVDPDHNERRLQIRDTETRLGNLMMSVDPDEPQGCRPIEIPGHPGEWLLFILP